MEKEDKKPYLEKQVHKEYLIIHYRHKTNIVSTFSPGNTGITVFNRYGLEYSLKRFWIDLRVVQTQAILFLKSMSGRFGSDIDRLWNWMMNF